MATGFEKVPFPPRASSAERPATLPSQAPYVPQNYAAYQQPAAQAQRSYTRFDAAYTPVGGAYAPAQAGAEPEVPAFVNENAGGRVSPFAAMPDMPAAPAAEPERPAEEQRAPRSFMDGIPAYMRRK